MSRFSLQNVKDAATNRVLRQVQDALNALSDGHQTLSSVVNQVNMQTQTMINVPTQIALKRVVATSAESSVTIVNDLRSLRAPLLADTWFAVVFPKTETAMPNYTITCRGAHDVNREVYYELRNVTLSGFEIKVTEPCTMELNTFEIISETSVTPVDSGKHYYGNPYQQLYNEG